MGYFLEHSTSQSERVQQVFNQSTRLANHAMFQSIMQKHIYFIIIILENCRLKHIQGGGCRVLLFFCIVSLRLLRSNLQFGLDG